MGIETATLIAYAAVAGAAVSAGTAVYTADQSRKAGHRAQDQAEADAEAALGQAQVEAGKIRKAAKASQSTAVAALAASGVEVQTGTAEQIQTDIGLRGEEDALTTILSGGNRAAYQRKGGAEAAYQGEMQQTAGYLNAAGSVLSSVASSARGWKGGGNDFSGAQGGGVRSNRGGG